MTAETQPDIARRARQVRVLCQQLDVELAKRPGALLPGETRDAMAMLNAVARGCPLLLYANEDRQLDAALGFLNLWRSMLSDQADLLWPDPDDGEDRI